MITTLSIRLLALGGILASASVQAAPVAPATKEYVLYSKDFSLPVGTVSTKTELMTMKDAVMKMSMQGQEINGTMSQNGDSLKITTIDSTTQRTVEIKKEETTGTAVINGQAMPSPAKPGALQGKTVLLTRVEGKWSAKLKEGEPTAKQSKKLQKMAKEMNSPDEAVILGTKPRKVGESWDVDPSQLSSFGGDDAGKFKGTFKVTFKSIEKKGGLDCAVLVSDIDIKGQTDDGMNLRMAGKVTVLQSLKYRTPMGLSMDVEFTMDGTLQGGAGTMHVQGPMKMEGTTALKLP